MSALLWLTWRQHRWTIAGTALLALFAAYALIRTETWELAGDSMPMSGFYGLMVQLIFGGVVGTFWGAPLISRELEERTYFVAWGQDVTPVKWLRGKAIVLGVLAALLGVVVGLGDGHVGSQLSWSAFESHPVVQMGYALFGLALGVFIGLLTRHVVTAIAATLVFYTFSRMLLSVFLRDHYLPVARVVSRWENVPDIPRGAMELGGGFVGRDLRPVSVPDVCEKHVNLNTCMRNTGSAVGTYVDYQPVERITAFQFIEFGVFAALTGVLFYLTFRLLRRGGGWKPSRSHRRISSAAESSDAEPVQSTPAVAAAQAEG
ncbi:MAG: hypothetical protein QOF58_7102 [Pseudonocardiales bacterium]|jgi:hypothetical protein|nr:hypothetical protein [Pseudonocardiales bacterium]